jgi:hypothetical protein
MLIAVIILSIILLLVLYKIYQFSLIILSFENAVEESLDILEERYKSLNSILQKEIFFDSVEVRQAISDIKASHEAILQVSHKLTSKVENISENKTEESKIN